MTWAPPALPRRLFLGGVAVQAVGVGRIDAEDLHLVGEERKVLQRRRHVAVLGVALHVGMEPGGDEIPPPTRVLSSLVRVDAVGGETAERVRTAPPARCAPGRPSR